MANNLKKKLVRENPVIARLQDPKYQRVNFLRSINRYTNWRYPTDRQLDVATQVMDEFDSNEKRQKIFDLSRKTLTGQVVTITRKPRNKGYYYILTVKCRNDRNTYLLRKPKALDGIKVGDMVRTTANLSACPMPGTYLLERPTKSSIL